MSPTVSIGIPFHNAASTLADAIRSVFAQTFQDWELILADDGSMDGSLAIATAVRDPRVRVLVDVNNRGPSYRRNQIAQAAGGRSIAWMDADDLMHPQRLEVQLEYLAANPHVDVLATAMIGIDAESTLLGLQHAEPLALSPRSILRSCPIGFPTVVAKRAWILNYRFDETNWRAEDHELWCRAYFQGGTTFDRVAEPLLFYREESSDSLCRKLSRSFRDAKKIVLKHGLWAMGLPHTCAELAALQLKIGALRLLPPTLVKRRLQSRRYTPLSSEQRSAYSKVVAEIQATRVPGLDDNAPSLAAA